MYFIFLISAGGYGTKEFTDLKINWLIENNRNDLMENLNQNKEFLKKQGSATLGRRKHSSS